MHTRTWLYEHSEFNDEVNALYTFSEKTFTQPTFCEQVRKGALYSDIDSEMEMRPRLRRDVTEGNAVRT